MPSRAVYFRVQKRKDTLVHGLVNRLPRHKGLKFFVMGPQGEIIALPSAILES